MSLTLAAIGAIGALASASISAYSTWKNQQNSQRDFDYQKSLQQDIFNREDNAVQRRMNDLNAAGLNPNLAVGSAAGAGSVVGRASTPQWQNNSIGAALDMASHVQQIRTQRVQNQILNNEKAVSDYNRDLARYEYGLNKLQNVFDKAALYQQLGINNMQLQFDKNGDVSLWSPSFKHNNGIFKMDIDDSPLFQQLRWQVQNNKNAADLLQKDVDWYTVDKIENLIGAGARAAGNIGSTYYNFNRRR